MSRFGVWIRRLFRLLRNLVSYVRGAERHRFRVGSDDLTVLTWLGNETVGHRRDINVNVIILTPIRIFGDGLAACFSSRSEISVVAIVNDLASLRDSVAAHESAVVLIDVTQGIDIFDVRAIATEFPDVPLLALGLNEQRQEVISCGRKGFAGYIPRDASVDVVSKALCDAAAGRLACPPEISGGLLRALFRREQCSDESHLDLALTRRESEVLELLGRGLSNKEIGNELCLSVATVKHHVHHLLEKLKLQKRAQAMRRVQDAPWIVHRSSARYRNVG